VFVSSATSGLPVQLTTRLSTAKVTVARTLVVLLPPTKVTAVYTLGFILNLPAEDGVAVSAAVLSQPDPMGTEATVTPGTDYYVLVACYGHPRVVEVEAIHVVRRVVARHFIRGRFIIYIPESDAAR
jgi:hypothetical protein